MATIMNLILSDVFCLLDKKDLDVEQISHLSPRGCLVTYGRKSDVRGKPPSRGLIEIRPEAQISGDQESITVRVGRNDQKFSGVLKRRDWPAELENLFDRSVHPPR